MKSIEQLAREARSETSRGMSSVRDHCPCGSVAYEYPAVGPRWERCVRCLAYLSLGPSNDTPEVLVEIRLAWRLEEIAALWEPGHGRETVEDLAFREAWEHRGHIERRIADAEAQLKPISSLIAASSIGAGLHDIEERDDDAHLADVEAGRK